MFGNCCGLCTPFQYLSPETMNQVDKALGNVKKSHKAITFAGLINISQKKAVMLHHLAMSDSPFCKVHPSPNEAGKEAQQQAKIQENSTKLSNNQLKKKVDQVLD